MSRQVWHDKDPTLVEGRLILERNVKQYSSDPIRHFRVLILWISHFDGNLFGHRHFRFFIVSVNKTNFLSKMDFASMQVVDLRIFLQVSGVSCSFH